MSPGSVDTLVAVSESIQAREAEHRVEGRIGLTGKSVW